MTLKIISWNVNGIRSLFKKINMNKYFKKNNADIICFSEIKLTKNDESFVKNFDKNILDLYKFRYYNLSKIKKGYSGTLIWSKIKPLNIIFDMENHDKEGRIITLEYNKFYLVNVYTPNSGDVLQRLKYRTEDWDEDFRLFIKNLQEKKPVIIAGDLNCAHKEIDIHNPKLKNSAGFTDEERNTFDNLLKKNKLIDVYRHFNPTKKNIYTYWSYRMKSRERNKGWRIDYFLIDKKLKKYLESTNIDNKQLGSDHAPIILLLKKL